MTEPYWYYMKGDQPAGPVIESELRKMLEGEPLGLETLVRSESTAVWRPASQVEAFGGTAGLAVLPPPPTSPSKPASEVSQVRPWIRYLARNLDMLVYVVFLGVLLAFTAPSLLETDWSGRLTGHLTGMAFLFLWVFIETCLLATWGTTPGKCLLGIRVRDATGRKLSFARALERSIGVWWAGMGIGFPIATLCTQYVSYGRLREDGITPWDRRGRFVVSHERIGVVRIIVAILLVIGSVVWWVWAEMGE